LAFLAAWASGELIGYLRGWESSFDLLLEVLIKGYVSHDEMPLLYNAADRSAA